MKVGVLGAGQLGQMLGLAGLPLGFSFVFYDPTSNPCAAVVGKHIHAEYDDKTALRDFAHQVDLITYEFENVPVSTIQFLHRFKKPIFPPVEALETSQHRLKEKDFFKRLKIKTAPYYVMPAKHAPKVGYPLILKTCRYGYDGKGQFFIKSSKDLNQWIHENHPGEFIAEGYVDFDRELSIIAARDRDGKIVFYPLIENHHKNGILVKSQAPATHISKTLQKKGEALMTKVMRAFNYVGILCVELFEKKGELIANEMAPRVHNSGHFSIYASATSQFENHLRAIAGLPLGSTKSIVPAEMINIIGELPENINTILKNQNAHLHLYGKEPRPGRKLGHITICDR